MPELQSLRPDHAAAVLAFERENRAYFATFISDRGEEYFERFAERHAWLLADQETGGGAYRVLVSDDGSVLGRFNLIFTEDGIAELGYRVAQAAAGRGVASATVGEMCRLAVTDHGLRMLRAATSDANVASQKVLTNNGFVVVSRADPAQIGGQQGSWYQRDLTADS